MAQIVYEFEAEGGITRLMAIYANNDKISKIGPIRSIREVLIEPLTEFNAFLITSGGNANNLELLNSNIILNINASEESRFFWRDQKKYAPHNLYTSSDLFSLAIRDKNLSQFKPSFQAWLYKDTKIEDINVINRISIDYSDENYLVNWQYNLKNNNYIRFINETEQKDALNQETISAANVIIQNNDKSCYLLIDGHVISCKWYKNSELNRTIYQDLKEKELALNRGTTWIELITPKVDVQFN